MEEELEIYVDSLSGAIRQGELLARVVQYVPVLPIADGKVGMRKITHSFCVVLSQDCDLDWDYRAREAGEVESSEKTLRNVLLCETSSVEDVRHPNGPMTSKIWSLVTQNKNERYHFVEGFELNSKLVLPPLVLDFKRYFTVPTDHLYSQISREGARICRLSTPYAEHLSSRFTYFQGRVALPREHRKPEATA